MFSFRRKIFIVFSSFFISSLALAVDYTVEYSGLDDPRALKAIKSSAQLIALKKEHPPDSINALDYRAQSDIPEYIKILHAYGYYEAKVNIHLQNRRNHIRVLVSIDPGPRYRIESFDISLYCLSPEHPNTCCSLNLEQIGIEIGKPALAQTIVNAELKMLQILSECGYPLARVEDRKIVVDGLTKGMRVHLAVKTDEKISFGPLSISGINRVKPEYIEHKKVWKEGELYDNRLIEETQSALLNSGLFSSVLITHESTFSPDGKIPMKIELNETKHRTINLGASYQTVFGPGITFGWENRNIAGMGRKFSFQGDVTRISQTGLATYMHPEFGSLDQDFIWQAQAAHESLFAYSMRSYNMMQRFDRRFNKHVRGAMGIQEERLYVTESVDNGNYWLLEFPLYFRYSTANSLLDPTRGVTVEFTMTPTYSIGHPSQSYIVHSFSESSYLSLTKNARVVLAQQLTVGWLFSDGLHAVPLSKRFLGGSEQELRGYRYRTVSPLKEGKPEGGRSAIYFTVESRLRVSKKIGLVPFFDIGNVYTSPFPKAEGKWLKSTGLGLRYFSFMGPFRVDLAFPLDRRKGIDPVYRILVSIGQTF
ncbi:MAG TPA: BamA/TamA family outer membrane protein [Rhabdochlamydiaceae bacterium]|jgi:translocation and assembly module TamA